MIYFTDVKCGAAADVETSALAESVERQAAVLTYDFSGTVFDWAGFVVYIFFEMAF